jgi:hypothetical protein
MRRETLVKTAMTAIPALVMALGFLCTCGRSGGTQSPNRTKEKETRNGVYDGKWWLGAGSDERSGFLDGVADCVKWVAHAKWLTHDVDGLQEGITKYYKTRPQDSAMNVADAWRKVLSVSKPRKSIPGGEVWTNPHGYFDGQWWRESSESDNRGYLEGYLWCLRTCVNPPPETYSRPISYYADQISVYVRDHPKAEGEAVADILYRFRDRPKPK